MFLPLQKTLKSTLLLTFGILLTQANFVVAEESPKPIPESQHVSDNCPNCQNNQSGQSFYGSCPDCQNSMIFDDAGFGRCGKCRGGKRMRRPSPGTGWCAPTKYPVQRQRVQYQKYYPNYWSGYGAGYAQPYAPMVHTPTDTTQLGYYYQHVPTWTPQPWRIPGAAHPASWHNRYCGRYKRGRQCPSSDNGYHGYGYGYNYGNQGSYCPTCQPNSGDSGTESSHEKGPAPVKVPEPAASIKENFKFSVLPDVPPEV